MSYNVHLSTFTRNDFVKAPLLFCCALNITNCAMWHAQHVMQYLSNGLHLFLSWSVGSVWEGVQQERKNINKEEILNKKSCIRFGIVTFNNLQITNNCYFLHWTHFFLFVQTKYIAEMFPNLWIAYLKLWKFAKKNLLKSEANRFINKSSK